MKIPFINRKVKEDKDKRKGIIMFRGERIKVRSLNHKEEQDINIEFDIHKLGTKIDYYQNKLDDLKKKNDDTSDVDEILSGLLSDFYVMSEAASTYKTKLMVKKPEKWFKKLRLEEMTVLKHKVTMWSTFVDIDELYMEIFKHIKAYFGMSRARSQFSGEDVSKEMMKIEKEYITLKKKSKCLDSAIRLVRQQIAQDVELTIADGLDT